MKIIGLDVGQKRIGVAKVDSNTRIAVPVGFIEVDGSEWQEIARLGRVHSTNFYVLGLPRSNEGNETRQSMYVRQFAKTLVEKIPGAKVKFQDESLTSVVAEERLEASPKRQKKAAKKGGKGYERGDIDAEAATIILQDFVENFTKGEAGTKQMTDTSYNAGEPKAPSLPENIKGRAKKEGDKVALSAKKANTWLKKALIISPIALVLIIAGVIGVVVWRQNVIAERERMWAEMEAAMRPEVFNFTVRPGETIFDVKKHLSEVGYSENEIEAGFSHDYSSEAGLEYLKQKPAISTLEGFLYGETHEFYKDSSVEDILRVFLKGMGEVISTNNLETKFAAQGLSLYEGITLASVVQKEAAPTDQAEVARVFLNRIEAGMTLGSDVTVSYAVDLVDPDRQIYRDNAAALTIESCYNTRVNAGLPCGPIANPGLSALLAVAEPATNDYLFFLTGDDGVMYYGYTDTEHAQNIREHCQELCNVSL